MHGGKGCVDVPGVEACVSFLYDGLVF